MRKNSDLDIAMRNIRTIVGLIMVIVVIVIWVRNAWRIQQEHLTPFPFIQSEIEYIEDNLQNQN